MKSKLWIAALGALILPACIFSASAQTPPAAVTVMVNQQRVAFNGAEPIVMGGGSVFVPLRGVFQQLGGRIKWDAATMGITGSRPGHQFQIRIGAVQALVDGVPRTLTMAPQMIGATTYVPLRFASEALGAAVDWQPTTHTVLITSAR